MMAGIYLNNKYTKSTTINFFLLLDDYRYNYIVSKYGHTTHLYQQGSKGNCSTSEMYHAAPLKLVNWEW